MTSTSLSKHFMTTDVWAIVWQSFRPVRVEMWSERPRWGARKSSVLTVNVSTVQSLASRRGKGGMLVETGQSVRQFDVIKVPRSHVKRLRLSMLH